ncbi:MAG: DUF2062 domain-containing protein [Pseudomonadota bacterium]|nr:DUF2062 domain-containing protein [Pseudomonadota bacterium]
MKQWLKRITPDRAKIHKIQHLRVFGTLLHDPNLWHLNRRSASGAFAVGMFVMYLPPLGQMVIAAAGAIALRVNLPISVALVWLTNPLTIPPMYYFAYLVGSWILGKPVQAFEVEFWLHWRNWLEILAPLSLGSLVCATVCSAMGYLAVQAIWRWNLVRQIRLRRERYQASASRARMPSSKRQT